MTTGTKEATKVRGRVAPSQAVALTSYRVMATGKTKCSRKLALTST